MVEWKAIGCSLSGREIFRGFSGEVRRGERVRLSGPSGCGKTTFLRAMYGLVPHEGNFAFAGNLETTAALVPQSPDFGVELTAGEFLDEVFSWRANRAARPTAEAVGEMCRRFRRPSETRGARAAGLSGGEKQRLALAVAMLLPRELLILDEPFSALDAETAKAAAEVLLASGRTILYVTHRDPVEGFATREVSL